MPAVNVAPSWSCRLMLRRGTVAAFLSRWAPDGLTLGCVSEVAADTPRPDLWTASTPGARLRHPSRRPVEGPDERSAQHKFLLDESEMPTRWYNVMPDLPTPPPPPLHPGTGQPVGPDDLAPLFPMELILQEVTDRAVRRHPRRGARRLPAVAAVAAVPGAPAGEGARHAGPDLLQVRGRLARPGRTSRTPRCRRRTTTPRPGIRKLTTETGAGQWGTALAFACAQFGLECEVWQVARVVRPEALPQDHDRDVRRHGAPEPVAT